MIEHAEVLWLLLLLVPLVLIFVRRYKTGMRSIRALVGRPRRPAYENVYVVKSFFSAMLFVLFVAAAILALADITWGEVPITEEMGDYETVLAIDISRSMLAEDVAPSRLGRTSAVVKSVIGRAPGRRFAVVIFKGRGVAAVPMTDDAAALTGFLDVLSPAMLTSAGTDLEAGLDAALAAFPPRTNARKMIVLFSDGGFLDGNPNRAAERARNDNVVINTVGAGTATLTPIPLGDGSLVRDAAGNVVETRLRADVLESVAERTSGSYMRLDDPRIASFLSDLVAGTRTVGTLGYHFELRNRYRFFVVLALVFIGLSISVRVVRWRDVL